MKVKIWATGELERLMSIIDISHKLNLQTCTSLEEFFKIPFNWTCEHLPNVGDDFNWLEFSGLTEEMVSSVLWDQLEELSYNSYVVKKFWSKKDGNILCALTVDILANQ